MVEEENLIMVNSYKANSDKIVQAIYFDGANWAECQDFMAGKHCVYPSWIRDYDEYTFSYTSFKNGTQTFIKIFNCKKNNWIVKVIDGSITECFACSDWAFNNIFTLID